VALTDNRKQLSLEFRIQEPTPSHERSRPRRFKLNHNGHEVRQVACDFSVIGMLSKKKVPDRSRVNAQLNIQNLLISLRGPSPSQGKLLKKPSENRSLGVRYHNPTSKTMFCFSTRDRFSLARIAMRLCAISWASWSVCSPVFAKETIEQ
jgi:hypothetical protein